MTDAPILHVIDGLGLGGAERLLLAYAPRLRALGRDVRVVTLSVRDGNPHAQALQDAGVPVSLVPVAKLRRFDQIAALARHLREARPAVVHAHLEFAPTLSAATRFIHGGAVTATIHTAETYPLLSRTGLRHRLMFTLMNRMTDRLICLSPTNAAFLRRCGVTRTPIEVIANGIDTDEFRPRMPAERKVLRGALGYDEDAFVVLSVAVLRSPKGIDRLVAAFERIWVEAPHARLLVVGDGPERGALEAQTRALGLGGVVRFAGYRTDVAQLMALADLFVLPTLNDAQPTVVMEAMASGAPVIASAVGGLPDMITNGADGVLVPPDDVAALARATLGLIADPARRAALRREGRASVEARFSIDRQVGVLNDLYDQLIAERRVKACLIKA